MNHATRAGAALFLLLFTACGSEADLGTMEAAAKGGRDGGAPPPAQDPCPDPAVLCVDWMFPRGATPDGGALLRFMGPQVTADATFTFGGVPALSVVPEPVSGGVMVTAPPHAEGVVDVLVTKPDGQTFVASAFHYVWPPVITGFFPSSIYKPGDVVTITGERFPLAYGVGVMVGNTPAASIASRSETELVITVPKLDPGAYPLTVSTYIGQYDVSDGRLVYAKD